MPLKIMCLMLGLAALVGVLLSLIYLYLPVPVVPIIFGAVGVGALVPDLAHKSYTRWWWWQWRNR